MKDKKGVLFGIGVGPGDPELLTLKAQRLLLKTKHIFTATSAPSKESLALKIASPHLRKDAIIYPLSFPMTRDKEKLKRAWDENAKKVLNILKMGENAIFLTLGDPSTYSTFTYLYRTLNKLDDKIKIEVIPGITSFQAAAATLKIPLVESEESFVVISGAKGANELKKVIKWCDNIVILKAYKKYDDLISCIKEYNLVDHTVGVRHIGLEGESIAWDITKWDGDKPSYFTLLLLKKGQSKKRLTD